MRATGEELRQRFDEAKLKKMAAVFQKNTEQIAEEILKEKESEDELLEKEYLASKDLKKQQQEKLKNLTDKQKKELKKQEIEEAEKKKRELYDSRLLETQKGGKIKWARNGQGFDGVYEDKVIFKIKPGIMSYGLYDKNGKYSGSSTYFIKLKDKAEKLFKAL